MMEIGCKLCGSTTMINENGFAVCQKCGARQIVKNQGVCQPRKAVAESDVVATAQIEETVDVDLLLDKAFLLLKNGDVQSSYECFESILDREPFEARAYLGELMIDMGVRVKEQLGCGNAPFDDNANYKKILKFGDDALVSEVKGYCDSLKNKFVSKENEVFQQDQQYKANKPTYEMNPQLEAIYLRAKSFMDKDTAYDYSKASELFASISEYKDSDRLKKLCDKKIIESKKRHTYTSAVKCFKKRDKKNVEKAMNMFKQLGEFNDSVHYYEECKFILNNKKYKKKGVWIYVLIAVLIIGIAIVPIVLTQRDIMKKVDEYMEDGEYVKAIDTMWQSAYDETRYYEKFCECLENIREQNDFKYNQYVIYRDEYGDEIEAFVENGKILAVDGEHELYDEFGEPVFKSWNNVIEIQNLSDLLIVGLCEDGSVLVHETDLYYVEHVGDSTVYQWKGIVDLRMSGEYCLEGVKYNGDIVKVVFEPEYMRFRMIEE